MLPLCADEGVATVIWSPLARGRLARPFDQANAGERSATDGAYADTLYTNAAGDRQIIDEVGAVAEARGVTRAQVALAWLRRNPVVAAPIVGARTIQQIDDAVASLDLDLTDEEARRLEAPYTPRYDFQGISDVRVLERIKAGIPGYANL
jgi:aryl-alcohol dehydrogenase-like predicted oxidoreductase